jgi:preprotein translocase subunit SecY
MQLLLLHGAASLEGVFGSTMQNAAHLFMLGIGPIIDASIIVSMLMHIKGAPLYKHAKELMEQGRHVGALMHCSGGEGDCLWFGSVEGVHS